MSAMFGSLEKRLIGALLLIVLCTGALQMISQDRAIRLREESEVLRVAASNTEHAEQLVKAVGQFRLTTHLYLTPGQDTDMARAADELTDAAMRIGDQINVLRMSGMTLYALDMSVFDGIDRHIGAISKAAHDGRPAGHEALYARNVQMAALANAIQAQAGAEREQAFDQLSHSARNWQMLVTVAGTITLAVVVLILLDLLRNILPALRRMHVTLRRLADGDLDFEVEEFQLHELKALSGSLETFRRNALAVKSLAFTDPSTGMPNRRAFADRAGARLAAGRREGEDGFVLLLADVDKFKHVNDDYGHAAGDLLVRLIGERMAAQLGDGAIVARVGGDEFAICAAVKDKAAAAIGSELVAAVREPFDLGGFPVVVTISLGLVETEGDLEGDVSALLNRADLALYAAKNGGRNRATCFTAELEEERELNRALERDLARAFEDGQLRMVYQPIHAIGAKDQTVEEEVEALVRWRHPVLGEISPARFIPAAERSGLMVQLGQWIVGKALADLARWPQLTMSINLSPLQLQQDGFVGFLLECCKDNRILPQRVILEVTESFSIERNTRALLTLTLLRGAGFRIALDDFGTGYSSLCMMKTFKFDRLKLDRSLITDIGKDPTSQAVFDAAVTMALRIGAEVVAEGISEEELVEPVRSAGCTHVQGFHYSRPIEAEAVEGYYRAGKVAIRKVA
jgi:diguanylate cyclase (GGDEF)-like protein